MDELQRPLGAYYKQYKGRNSGPINEEQGGDETHTMIIDNRGVHPENEKEDKHDKSKEEQDEIHESPTRKEVDTTMIRDEDDRSIDGQEYEKDQEETGSEVAGEDANTHGAGDRS